MHVGFVVYGDVQQTSGGYRYDRKLRDYLEAHDSTVEILSIDENDAVHHIGENWSPTLYKRLNQPFDVLLQDAWCSRSLWRINTQLSRPGALVGIVHLLRSGPSDQYSISTRRYNQFVERTYLGTLDGAICTSQDTKRRVATLCDTESIVAPPSGRVEGRAMSVKDVKRRARRNEPLRLLTIGNVIPRKGVKTVIEAVDASSVPLEYTIIGSLTEAPTYANTVQRLAREVAEPTSITFTGKVSRATLKAELTRSHVLAMPSRYEGFGMVYLEAMEYGVVPLASAIGGANDLVREGENGYLIEPEDVKTLRQRVEKLVNDRDALAALGTAALSTADEHPTWDESMRTIHSYLQQV